MCKREAEYRAGGGNGRSGEAGGRGRRRVALDRRVRVRREPEQLRRLRQQEERAEVAGQLVVRLLVDAVQVCVVAAAIVQLGHARLRALRQLVPGAELDRV